MGMLQAQHRNMLHDRIFCAYCTLTTPLVVGQDAWAPWMDLMILMMTLDYLLLESLVLDYLGRDHLGYCNHLCCISLH